MKRAAPAIGIGTSMTVENEKTLSALALELIGIAFADRARPSIMTTSKQLSDLEYEEVMSYEGMRWQDVTFVQVEQYPDAVFWFSPEAFCYYLPGILAAGLREKRWDSSAYDSLIGLLDRSPEPNYWDDFFLPRCKLLTTAEIEAVAAWARWLQAVDPDAYHFNTFERVQATLTLVSEKHFDD
jgi:hypothetical protein